MKTILLLLCLPIFSLAQQKQFSWLIGTWKEENTKNSELSFEVWKADTDFLLAESYSLKGNNKVISENIKLIKKGNDFYFVPDVVRTKQGPIDFKITSFDDSSFTAENSQHDFPKKIIYKRIDENHLQAFVQDDSTILRFYFTKMK